MILLPGLTQWTLAAHRFVLVLYGRLSWILRAFDRTLIVMDKAVGCYAYGNMFCWL